MGVRVKIKRSVFNLNAYTLTELLVVLVIVGVLVLLAVPRLLPLVSRAKSTEAKIQLKHLYELQKVHHMERSQYSESFEDLDYEPVELIEDGGDARYVVEIVEADNQGFLARATAVEDYDGDGVYNVWEIGSDVKLTEVTKD